MELGLCVDCLACIEEANHKINTKIVYICRAFFHLVLTKCLVIFKTLPLVLQPGSERYAAAMQQLTCSSTLLQYVSARHL